MSQSLGAGGSKRIAQCTPSNLCLAQGAVEAEHFFSAFEHGIALLGAGAGRSILDILAEGAARRGLGDACAGFLHAKLRFMGEEISSADFRRKIGILANFDREGG